MPGQSALQKTTPVKTLKAAYGRQTRILGLSQIRAMAASPAGAPPLMATPPVVTQDTSTTLGAGFTSPSYFRWSGPLAASPTVAGSMQPQGSTSKLGAVNFNAVAAQMAFDCDGRYVDIQVRANSTLRYRVWVNEQASSADLVALPSGTGANAYLHLDFGSMTQGIPRRIVVEFEDPTNPPTVLSVRCGVLDYFATPAATSPRVLWVGDSFARGTNGISRQSFAYARQAGRILGWADCWNQHCSFPGTGLVHADATYGNYGDRLAYDVLPYKPDVLVIQGSINDQTHAGAVGPALIDYVNRVRAALPATVIVVTSPLVVAAPSAAQQTIATEMAAAAATLGVPYVDTITFPIFRGTGAVGSPQAGGGGEADWARAADFTHPTDAGAYALAQVVAGMVGQAVGTPTTAASAIAAPATTSGFTPHIANVPAAIPTAAASITTAPVYQAGSIYNVTVNAGTAISNYLEWEVLVAAGTYTLQVIYVKATNEGIATISIDGVDLGTTIDMYASAFAANGITAIVGVTIAADGFHRVRFRADTKNASATAYAMVIQGFSLTRTGA